MTGEGECRTENVIGHDLLLTSCSCQVAHGMRGWVQCAETYIYIKAVKDWR